MTILTALPLGLILVIAALVYLALKLYRAKKTGQPVRVPVMIERGAFAKLLETAKTGNVALLADAAVASVHLDLAEGSIERTLLTYALDEVQLELNTPGRPTPIVDGISHLTGVPRQRVLDLARAELLGPARVTAQPQSSVPSATTTPTALAAPALLCAIALLSTTSSSAWAASPLTPPPRFEATELPIVIDSPVFRGPVYESQRGEILLPNRAYSQDRGQLPLIGGQCPSCDRFAPTNSPLNTHHSPAYFGNFRVPSPTAAAAATCRVPDRGPVIFITYYFMQSCSACDEATEASLALKQAGWNIIGFDADTDTGYWLARLDKVNFVPYWEVSVDGKTTLRTTNWRTLYDHLGKLRSRAATGAGEQYQYYTSCSQPANYQQCSYQQTYSQPLYYQQPTYHQVYYYGNQNVGFWQRGPVRRGFRGFFGWVFRGRRG